jgi:hypothetical protein
MNLESKVFFGLDFMHMALEIGTRSGRESDDHGAAAKLLLLIGWELNSAQTKQSEAEFWRRNDDGSLDRLATALTRLIDNLKEDGEARERLVLHALVLSTLNSAATSRQLELVGWLVQYFSMDEATLERLKSGARNVQRALAALRGTPPSVPDSE